MHTVTTTKLTAQPKPHSPDTQGKRQHFFEQHSTRQSITMIASEFLKRSGSHSFCIYSAFSWTLVNFGFFPKKQNNSKHWKSTAGRQAEDPSRSKRCSLLPCLLLAWLLLPAKSNFSLACQRQQQASYYPDWHAPPKGLPKYCVRKVKKSWLLLNTTAFLSLLKLCRGVFMLQMSPVEQI